MPEVSQPRQLPDVNVDSHVDDELDIFVGNIVKFKALPGSSVENYAVKVTEIIREE